MTDEHPRKALARLEQQARRRFGQHFLWRNDVVTRIVRGSRVRAGDKVLEIGPGLGILTRALLSAGTDVTAVELDRDLAEHVRQTFPEIRLIEGDALQVDLETLCPGSGWKVVANLPYNVGTMLVIKMVRMHGTFDSLTVMLQKEVVDRLLAPPGSRTYGALTLQVQAFAEVHFVAKVPPSAFHPRPKVDSAVIRLELRDEPAVGPAGVDAFLRTVKAGFSQRRKTLVNSLSSLFSKERSRAVAEQLGLDPKVRGEQLDAETFRALAAALHSPSEDETS